MLRLSLSEGARRWLEESQRSDPALARTVAAWIRDVLCDPDADVESIPVEDGPYVESVVDDSSVVVAWTVRSNGTVRVAYFDWL